MKILTLFTTPLALLLGVAMQAQTWNRLENLPATEFTALALIDQTLYTASGTTVYFSTDAGAQWQPVTITNSNTDVRALIRFGNRLYAGTGIGIFSAPMNHLSGPWTLHVNTGWVSSFAARDGQLFASTLGGGVYRRNPDGTWVNFSNGIPSYSLTVHKLLDTPDSLIAVAGSNGTLYRFLAEANTWIEHYYENQTYNPGLDFDDAQRVGNTLYVSRYNKVLRSDNFGYHWTADQTGLMSGLNRTMAVAGDYLYTLTTTATQDSNYTFLRKRPLDETDTDWSVGSETLNFYSYAMLQCEQKLIIASNQGIYVKDASLGTGIPDADPAPIVIFPNPSPDGRFTIQSGATLGDVTVYDVTGKKVYEMPDAGSALEFEVLSPGFYWVRTGSGTSVKTFKILAQCRQ